MAHQRQEKKKKASANTETLQVAWTTKGTVSKRQQKVIHAAVIATVGDSLLKFGWDIKRVAVHSGL